MNGIQEIAAATGLSKSTVSRALRNLPSVAPSTIMAVRRKADELGYIPSSAASGLATGRTRAVGVVVPVIDRWFYIQVLEGVDAELRRAGYDLILFNLGGLAGDRERVFHRSILRKRVDALILLSLVFEDDERRQLETMEYPTLVIGGPAPGVRHLGIDDYAVARTATEYLLGLGHRAIAHIGGQDREGLNTAVPGERHEGFADALATHGIEPRPEWDGNGAFSFQGGHDAMARILASDSRPTAVFAASDEMAFGAIVAIREAGLRIPEDLSVVGIDGHAYGEVLGLTTFSQDPVEQGRFAARVLLAELAGQPPVPWLDPAPVRFIERTSAGPAPSA
ncbi:LacI family DNA-binding transcriptional regulator [Frondihabitans cladoniiphilus]|uniref:Substrate-binding domain-containing protein n=1 Tax=Frondihabitans cladoniiphilus TaxID=715785 RepID=A0ABP8VV85_9MICO